MYTSNKLLLLLFCAQYFEFPLGLALLVKMSLSLSHLTIISYTCKYSYYKYILYDSNIPLSFAS